jgi:hypothetical protein
MMASRRVETAARAEQGATMSDFAHILLTFRTIDISGRVADVDWLLNYDWTRVRPTLLDNL